MESLPAEPAKHGCAALFLGTIVYLGVTLDGTVEDPVRSLIFQSILGFTVSLVLMYVSRLLGLLLLVEPFSDIWYWSRLVPSTVIAIGFTGICYHEQIPPSLFFISWFSVIFGTTHFWIKKPGQERAGEMPPPGNESL